TPSLKDSIASPPRSPQHSGPNDIPTESPHDFPREDFTGMPADAVVDAPTDNAVVMAPGIPIGITPDSPACYPSESPSRRVQVIDVGFPTDMIGIPSMDDGLEDFGIGMVSPEPSKPPPISVRPTTKKELPARKARVHPRAQSLPNTLEAQYWRQSASRRYYGRGPPPPVPLYDPNKPLTQQRYSYSVATATRGPGWSLQSSRNRPYRRGPGLSPMPYALPPFPSPPPPPTAGGARRYSVPSTYRPATTMKYQLPWQR
ncbi:expressed unknown protein (Partial), partial [Seminavis robusta]